MKEHVDVIIELDGTYNTDVKKGPGGKGCLKLTADIEEALGNKVIKRTPKPEMNQKEIADKVTVGR